MAAVHPDHLSSQPVGYNVPTMLPTTHNKDDLRRCVVCFLQFLALLSVIIFLIFVIYVNSVSNVEYPTLEIDSLTLSNLNLSSSPNQISADWNVQMNCKAMDRHESYVFSNIKVLIYYNDKIVGVTNLMSFDISPKDPPMHIGGEFFSRLSGYINDSIIRDITQGINVGGTLKFNVEFSGMVKITYKGLLGTDSEEPYLWVYNCDNVELFFGYSDASRAQMLNASHKCKRTEDLIS